MNILLVNNVASFHSILAESLNQIPGIQAKYLIKSQHQYTPDNQYMVFAKLWERRRNPFKYIYHKLTYKRKIRCLIDWADVVYYLATEIMEDFDLPYAHSKGKKIYVEWVGSDIRDPEILKKINPWYAEIFDNGYEYRDAESSDFKNRVQEKFARNGARVISTPEMSLYLKKALFPEFTTILQRINTKNFEARIPDPQKQRIKIVHSPSAPVTKGSKYVFEAVEKLKTSYPIDFIYLTGMSRQEVLKEIQSSDIFVDQLICGSHGMATCEAMSFGKPVLCYLIPELFEHGLPAECPIINTNPSNLEENLIRLITDGKLRQETGRKSRLYVEKYHNSDTIAQELVSLFKNALNS